MDKRVKTKSHKSSPNAAAVEYNSGPDGWLPVLSQHNGRVYVSGFGRFRK